MSDSDQSYVSFERKEDLTAVKKPTHFCTEWSEFFRFATPHGGVISKANNGMSALTREHDDLLRNIPHSSVNGWTTLIRSKPEHPLFHLPNTSEGSFLTHMKNDFVDINPSVVNAVLFFQRGERDLDVLRGQRSAISFIKNFLYKISKALQSEKAFESSLSTAKVCVVEGEHRRANADSELDGGEFHFDLRLPKLGKVYAELRSSMKTCEEAFDRCSISNPQLVRGCKSLQKESFKLQGKMLLQVRWLIEARLRNIGQLVALQYEEEHFDFDEVFSTSENKRFCKLLELYNEYTVKHLKSCGMNEKELRVIFGDSAQTFVNDSPYIPGLGETHCTLKASVIYPLAVGKALDILSESFMSKAGFQVVKIFKKCQTVRQLELPKASNPPRNATELGFVWEQASRIEMRPVRTSNHKASFFRVIKRVAGINVPDISSDEAVKECMKLSRWLKKHERVVALFVSGLGGKTKILRRSINLQDPYLSDDSMSVSSTSSLASSAVARQADIKSVSWKDSWNNEAMKSITLSYLELAINSISNCFWKAESQVLGDERLMVRFGKDIDMILLQAVVSNLSHLNIMSEKLHGALLNTSTEILIKSALSCSDSLLCEMLGKATPMFDKPAIQKKRDGTGVSLVIHLCIAAFQPLFHLMEFYSQYDTVAREVLPAIEILLNAGFAWIRKKIQEYSSALDLTALLLICLCDLREMTTVGLDSLKLVEGCHNHIETRRNRDSATLALATKHLHNIDSLITSMQMTSGSSMMQLGVLAKNGTSKIIVSHFPPQKLWIQKNMIDCEQDNDYVDKIVQNIIKVACFAVSKMDVQCQLAGMTPIINSVFEVCLDHVAKSRTKFSLQGAMQLSYDFSTIINFVTADISELSHETRTSLSCLHSVKRAIHIAQLLQSTSFDDSVDERFRPQDRTSSPSSTLDTNVPIDEQDDKFWLSLRKSNMKRSKTWASLLPCMDK